MSNTETFRSRASSVHWGSNIDPTTPEGLKKNYAIGAGDCLAAAKFLDQSSTVSNGGGQYIITFHVIELSLKAFLVRSGMTEAKLRKHFRHDLNALYAEAVRRGLVLPQADADMFIDWINEWHSDDGSKIRYQFAGPRYLPMCRDLFPIAEAIIAAADR